MKSPGKGFLLGWEVVLNETQDPSNARSLKAEGTASGCSLHMLAVYEYFPSVTIKWLKTICIFSSWLHRWPGPAIANQAVSFVPCIITMKTLEPEVSWQFS